MNQEQKWFHAIGVCGKTTANVAKMFKDMGWFVTGTDVQFIPPASTLLEQSQIPTEVGYSYLHLTKAFWENKLGRKLNIPEHPNMGLIVESATSKNKELLYAKKNSIDIRPFAQILNEYLIKNESIVVVGTAGKTTTTALITFLLKELDYNPSYMIGAEVKDFDESIKNTNSNYSVIEGDEYYSKELSTGAKFLQYKPKYAVVTKVTWEHVDVYPTEEEYVKEFKKFIGLVPSSGIIIAKMHDKNIDIALTGFKASLLRYAYVASVDKIKNYAANCFFITNVNNEYQIYNSKKELLVKGSTNLLGEYNLENILATFLIFNNVIKHKDYNKFAHIISKFNGPKKRLEHLVKTANTIVIDDFGVAPERAANSLRTLKESYPDYKITAVFEPNSGSRPVDISTFNKIYKGAFDDADKVIVPTLSETPNLMQTEEFVNNLSKLKNNVLFVPTESLKSEIINKLNGKNLFVFFSAYRLTNIAQEVATEIKNLSV